MDAERFDRFARTLVTRADRRRMLQGVSSVVAALLGVLAMDSPEVAAGRRRRRRRRGGGGGGGGGGSSSSSSSAAGGGGGGGGGGSSSSSGGGGGVDAPGGGSGGTCEACPPGSTTCTVNGSCSRPCTNSEDCGNLTNIGPCAGCSATNTEGTAACIAHLPDCPTQTCASTAECPRGYQCQPCDGGPPVCFPLCLP